MDMHAVVHYIPNYNLILNCSWGTDSFIHKILLFFLLNYCNQYRNNCLLFIDDGYEKRF